MGISVFSSPTAQFFHWDFRSEHCFLNRVVSVLGLASRPFVRPVGLAARRGQFGWMPETMWKRNAALLQARLDLDRPR